MVELPQTVYCWGSLRAAERCVRVLSSSCPPVAGQPCVLLLSSWCSQLSCYCPLATLANPVSSSCRISLSAQVGQKCLPPGSGVPLPPRDARSCSCQRWVPLLLLWIATWPSLEQSGPKSGRGPTSLGDRLQRFWSTRGEGSLRPTTKGGGELIGMAPTS